MKKKMIFGLLATLLCLCALPSCGGDTDKDFSENIIGYWQGSFVKLGYNADSTEMVYTLSDPSTILKFSYPELCVRGKGGPGSQQEGDSIAHFTWEMKYGKLHINFDEHPESNLEIWYYGFPLDTVFEGRVDNIPFKMFKK